MATEIGFPGAEVAVAKKPAFSRPRLTSLDVFRGITVAAMVLVNDSGDRHHIYWPLEHAEWNGWTPTDLVFPFFIFIVGVSMVLSFDSRKAKGASNAQCLLHAAKRSTIIFLLGLFLYAYPRFDVHTTRIPGVLQRIAVVYLITCPVVLYIGRSARYLICAGLLLAYWSLMILVPVPGYGAGVLTMDGSLATYVDRTLLYNHLFTPHRFDPEGILSTIPAIATCLFGVTAGEWMQTKNGTQLIRRLLVVGSVGITLGYLWNVWFPINKQLWTSSYTVFTAGFAMASLAFVYWIVDIRRWTKWARPFTWFGANPLAIYFLASLLLVFTSYPAFGGLRIKQHVYGKFYAHLFASPYMDSLLYALSVTFLLGFVAWLMYRRRILIRI